MEIRTMFWLIAGLMFFAIILLVGIMLAGSLMKLQTCAEDDIYTPISTNDEGTECGDGVYCNFAVVGGFFEETGGVRRTYREKDACIDREDHLCCRTCYEAGSGGPYKGGNPCGTVTVDNQERTLTCLNVEYEIPGADLVETELFSSQRKDICTDHEAHRCCRDWGQSEEWYIVAVNKFYSLAE